MLAEYYRVININHSLHHDHARRGCDICDRVTLVMLAFSARRVLIQGLQRTMSMTRSAPLLLSPSQATRLPPQSTVFVDASWVMPNSPRKPKEEYEACRISTSKFLEIDEVASRTEEGARLGLQHMMPDPQVFARACGGIICLKAVMSDFFKCNAYFQNNWGLNAILTSFCMSMDSYVVYN